MHINFYARVLPFSCLFYVLSSKTCCTRVAPSMPKRPADDVDISLEESVQLTSTPSSSSQPCVTLARCIGETLPELGTSSTHVSAPSLVMLTPVSLSCSSASSTARTVEHIREFPGPVKICKADVREWLAAAGESFSATSSSVELKAKLDNYFHNNRCAPPVVLTCMPQRVLAKFVKFIIFQQQQAGFLADATPAMIGIKEKAIWRLID